MRQQARQRLATQFMLFSSGFISLIAVTEGNGITYLFDVINLENDLWDNVSEITNISRRMFTERS